MSGWYTDKMDVFRTVAHRSGSLETLGREAIYQNVPCRIYRRYRSSFKALELGDTAPQLAQDCQVMVGLEVEVRPGDELHISRGGSLGREGPVLRALAGSVNRFYEPVAGVRTGLEHQEIRLISKELV